jgi:hypothetical protein
MSEFDPHPDDEVVSAYLDGEATAEEVQRVENDPILLKRLEDLRLVTRAVAGPAGVTDPTSRDRAVAHAIAAARASDEEELLAANVVSLRAERHRRRRTAVVAAAAAGLLLLLALPLVGRLTGSGDDATQTAAVDAPESDRVGSPDDADDEAPLDEVPLDDRSGAEEESFAVDAEGGAEPDPSTGGAAPDVPADESAEPSGIPHLGSFASRRAAQPAVTAAVDTALGASRLGTDRGIDPEALFDAASQLCLDDLTTADEEAGALLYTATLDLPSGPRQLFLFELAPTGSANGTHRLYEVDRSSCAVVSDQTLS